MILEPGSKTLIVHRRLFESDSPRYFVGTVDAYEHGVARVTGHTWLVDQLGGSFFRKPDSRTKIISLSAGTMIVYQLPASADLPHIKFEKYAGRIVLTDGKELKMDLCETEHAPEKKR